MMEHFETRDTEDQDKGPWVLWAALLLFSAAAMAYLFYFYPQADIGPEQPIAFSHRVHAGVKGIQCRFCHPFVDRSLRAGIPAMEKCFFCHEYIIPLHPEILKERRHYEGGDPVRWVKLFIVPDHVQFLHRPHTLWAKLECAECHGQVERMDRLPRVEFEMKFCIDCHRKKGAQLDCWLACHH